MIASRNSHKEPKDMTGNVSGLFHPDLNHFDDYGLVERDMRHQQLPHR